MRYVLDGSVRKSGDRLRINANLVEAENAHQVWAEQYDRELTDIFALQDEVIGHIVSALAIKLTAVEEKQIARVPTENLEAYDYYLRAEQAARAGFRPQLRQALQLYEKAFALDPTFAEAFAADARTAAYVMRNDYDDVLAAPVARKRAYEHASRALDINAEASLPFSVLAILQVVDSQHEAALASAERAVAFGPSDAGCVYCSQPGADRHGALCGCGHRDRDGNTAKSQSSESGIVSWPGWPFSWRISPSVRSRSWSEPGPRHRTLRTPTSCLQRPTHGRGKSTTRVLLPPRP